MNVTLTNESSPDAEKVTIAPFPPRIDIVLAEEWAPGEPPKSIPNPIALPEFPGLSIKLIKTFPAGDGVKIFSNGENVTFQLTWDQKDNDGKQMSPGYYSYQYDYRIGSGSVIQSGQGGGGKACLIQYPQGAMQKIIEVNQSKRINNLPLQTDSGSRPVDLVLELKQVVLREEGSSFLVVGSSPNKPATGYSDGWTGMCVARYVVDGVTKDARSAITQVTDNGIVLRWGGEDNWLDPVPADAKQLSLVILGFANWKGPWEFQVPLK